MSIALEKSATAVRPLACGDPLRRLVGKCFCVGGKEEISKSFKGKNYGVGCPGGVEVVAHSLRDVLQKHRKSKFGLLKIDFRNAFNEIKRSHFVKAVDDMFPAMSNWTQWCYGEPTMLLYDHEFIIESCGGVQQGDPLGPLYFCCGIMALVNEIAALKPVYNKWYMDDGGIVGDVELLKKVWEVLKSRGPELGLHLNPSKCEWSWLDPECDLPCPIRLKGVAEAEQIKLVPHSEIQMLGVPLGDDEFVSGFVRKKLLGRLSETVEKLVSFEDTQAASYLLRVSYSIVRAVHFMRTTPLRQWQKEGEEFDRMVCDAAGRMLGHFFDARTFAQAALTPKLGGLGLRKSVEHAGFAYSASWHESRLQAGEDWDRPGQVSAVHVGQKEASYAFDEEMHKYLVDSAPNEREKQRLLRVARPHAGSFVTAVPSSEDGNDCLLKPRLFRLAVAYRLGFPVLSNEIPCPSCTQPINVYGDHAICCAKNGDLVIRHNALRNLVYNIASHGLLKPVLEKKGILGPTSGRRPGDVAIPDWKHHMGLAIDVAVTSPLTKRSLRLVSPCEDYAEVEKHRKYDASFVGTNYYFCAMVFETLGGVNVQGEEVLRQLFAFAAQHLGREFSSFCGRGWARVSCCLQRSVAQVVANRIDGSHEVSEVEDESVEMVAEGGEEEHEGDGYEGGESRGGAPLVGDLSVGVKNRPPVISRSSEGDFFPGRFPPFPPPIPSFPGEVKNGSVRSGVGGESGDLGDGGRDGEEGFTTHSENAHKDFNRILRGGPSQGPAQAQLGSAGSAKGQTQGLPQGGRSAKGTGTGHYKDSRGESSNKVTYSNRVDRSVFLPPNTHTSITTHPTYNKHNAGSSTSTSQNVEVRNREPRRGVYSIAVENKKNKNQKKQSQKKKSKKESQKKEQKS